MPNSSIYFFNVPFPSDLSHVVDHENFLPEPIKIINRYKYVHMNAPIDVNCSIDDIMNANYIMFINPNFGNRWIYAFITDLTFINGNVTRVTFDVDAWQTYKGDIIFCDSFIEREHVNNDEPGLHTLPEGLEIGEYINASEETNLLDPTVVSCVFVNARYVNNRWQPVIAEYDGFLNAAAIYAFDATSSGNDQMFELLERYIKDGREDNILGIILLNKRLLGTASTGLVPVNITAETVRSTHVMAKKDFQGYKPKNNKLYTFPYQTLFWHNNAGTGRYLKPFFDSTPLEQGATAFTFTTIGSMKNLAPVVKCTCLTAGKVPSRDNHMTLSGFPMLSWNSNAYASYLANNAGNLAVQAIGAVGGIVAMPFTGGVSAGAAAGGLMGIMQSLAALYDRSKQTSNVEGNLNSSIVNVLDGSMTFSVQEKTITREYAEIIDRFFTMFGYKVNMTKKPNITGRKSWNYVKTNGLNIKGEIPQVMCEKLKTAFDNGITIWHSYDGMYNYSTDNSIRR